MYYSKNRDRDILIWIGELNKKNINIQKNFVVRYQDINGEHIRYRIKLNDNEDDKQIVTLFREFNEFSETGAIKDVDICTYYQETNRYGGINLIDDIETFFDADTKLIIHINELYKIDTLDRYQEFQLYTIGILTILLEFYYDYEEIYIKLHKNVVDNNNKKYYRSMKEYIIPFIETIINGEMPIKTRIDEQKLLCRKKEMRKIKSKLESYGDDERDNIIFSLIHMYCNRLNGDNTLENKYLELIKYALKEIISRNKYIRSKSYNGETYN